MPKIGFSDREIILRLDDIIMKKREEALADRSELFHELRNYNSTIGGAAEMLISHYDVKGNMRVQLSDMAQAAARLTDNVNSISRAIDEIWNCRMLPEDKYGDCLKKVLHSQNSLIQAYSLMITVNLKDILNIKEKVHKQRSNPNIDPEIANIISMIDDQADKAIYHYNLQFSSELQKTEYHPAADIRSYAEKNRYNDGFTSAKVSIGHLEESMIRGKGKDILKNAIIPLYTNVNKHAFNPDNDRYDRSKKNFSKEVIIESFANVNEETILYSIFDNGFGISESVKNLLLTRSGITGKDNPEDTGEGLWGVKKFVESLGGRLWFETQSGLCTTFKFTVPYHNIGDGIYITDATKARRHKLII